MEFQQVIVWIDRGAELAGVLILVVGIVVALISFAAAILAHHVGDQSYRTLRQILGRAILLGLEFLVAADIIRSVALEPTFESVGVLGLIVAVRTFLSWSLEVEITGAWPWQQARPRGMPGASDDLNNW
jgi:uncharacterized membrane protein